MSNSPVKKLMQKPMDRKGFLQHVGAGMVMVMGGGMVVNSLNLANKHAQHDKVASTGPAGYGMSAYGK